MPAPELSAPHLAAEIRAVSQDLRTRVIVGFAGPPGSGKSTLAERVCAELGDSAVLVPLDGWHLSAELTRRMGAAGRRGAPDTFDAAGFVVLLRRLRAQAEFGDAPTIYAPEYRREIEEPVAGAIAVHAETPVVVVEGNYLLLDRPVWRDVHPLLDLSYYVRLDPAERQRRLVNRHQQFGKSPGEARRWTESSDEQNALLIDSLLLPPTRVVPGP